jgi:hypothetical protein
MKAEPSFPRLKVVELSRLHHHEEHDPARVDRLMASLNEDGVLRNPLVVAVRGGAHIVLDGVSRSLALRRMGIPCAAAQVVDDGAGCVRLETWNHVLIGPPADRILKGLLQIPDMSMRSVSLPCLRRSLARGESMLGILLCDGRCYGFQSTSAAPQRSQSLCELVGTYREVAEVHRTTETDLPALATQHPQMSALVLFPRIRNRDVTHAALNHTKLPMGITRHLIRGRALGLNIPLELLASNSSLEAKDARLQEAVRDRLRGNGIRLYPEATYVFDEAG